MRPNAKTNEFARRMLDRPVAPSLLAGEIWNDIPHKIGLALGGRDFFFEEECTALHRVGIGLGLAWRYPRYKQRSDGIDYVRIYVSGGYLEMQFLHCGDSPPEEAHLVRGIAGLQYSQLLSTYHREMYGAEI